MAIRQAGEVGRLPSSMASDLLDSLPVAVGCVDAEECVVFVNRAFSAAVAVAAGAQLRGAPDPLGRLGACARQVITTGAPSELTVAGTPGWARVFPVGAEHAGVVLAGPVSAAARSAEEQAALRRVAMLVAKDAAPEAVFAVASEQVGRLLGAEVGAVLRFVGAERAIVAGVWREDGIRGFPVNAELDFERTNSAIGRVLATRRPARADTYEDARGQLPRVLKAVGVRSSVAAPVMLDDAVWGAVTVSTTRDEPLPEGGEMKLVAFAELVGQTLADAEARRRLAASRLRLVEAADAARRRLESDLHEGAQQHLVALLLQLRVAQARAPEGSEIAKLLAASLTEADQVHAALHELARGLHPAILSERGLAAALQGILARSPIPITLRSLPARRYADAIEGTAYFLIDEGIDNAAAHAHATEVVVDVDDMGDQLVVRVADNGIGGATPRPGGGLRALADRAVAVGGRLHIDSPPGGGTVLRAEIPVERGR